MKQESGWQGSHVTVVEIADEILGGAGALPHMNHFMLEDLITYHRIDVHTKSSVVKSNDEGVVISTPQGEKLLPADGIITSIGYIANNRIYEELKDMDIPVYTGYIISCMRSGMPTSLQEISDTVQRKTGQCDPFLLFFLQDPTIIQKSFYPKATSMIIIIRNPIMTP